MSWDRRVDMQQSLFNNIQPHISNKKSPTYKKPDKIWNNIKEWNTIEGIELYQPLYDLCSQLFILTCNHKLACLDYSITEEIDNDKTYTVMLAEIHDTCYLPLKERYKLHEELLNRILNNDPTLEYQDKPIDSDTLTLFNSINY